MSEPSPSRTDVRIRGRLERFDENGARGWITVEAGPESKLRLEIVVDGKVIGGCTADRYRGDVAERGFGDGKCGFAYAFPAELPAERRSRARLRIAATEIYLEPPKTEVFASADESVESAPSPVFIVGSPRSGTSILVSGLLSTGYNGYREGNFLGLINDLSMRIDRHFRTFGTTHSSILTAHLRPERLKEEIFLRIRALIDELNPVAPWLDKTGNPDMILALPWLFRLWPSCHVIFAKRRGIENIVSRTRKFASHDFTYHCTDWARNMAAWREVRPTLPAARWIEIDQHEIALDPQAVAERLGRLLRLDHDQVATLHSRFVSERPQQTDQGSADRVYTLEETGWGPDQIAIFLRVCGPEMECYGYDTDSYWRSEPRLDHFDERARLTG